MSDPLADREGKLLRRIEELTAENKLIKDDFDRVQRECKHETIRAARLEGMLRLAYHGQFSRLCPVTVEEWTADLARRYAEQKAADTSDLFYSIPPRFRASANWRIVESDVEEEVADA